MYIYVISVTVLNKIESFSWKYYKNIINIYLYQEEYKMIALCKLKKWKKLKELRAIMFSFNLLNKLNFSFSIVLIDIKEYLFKMLDI